MEISDTSVLAALGALATVITTLAGAIAKMYQIQVTNHRKVESKLNNCEKQHDEANEKIIALSERVGELIGIEQMYNHVTEQIRKVKGN